MSTGLYSHTTRGIGTVLTAAIYNADHANHITNANPSMHGGYSDSVPQMRLVTDPGGVGSEILTGSLAGEIERIRFAIKRIAGTTQWYEAPVTNLGTIGGGTPLTLAFAARPLTLRRTENNTTELEFISVQAGSGVGNKYSQWLVGTGANAVAEIRDYIGTTELERLALALKTHFIGQEYRSFLDIKEMIAPATPAADISRLYSRDVSGFTKLIYKDPNGKEYPLGTRGVRGYSALTSFTSITTVIPLDDTVPTSSEGDQILSLTATLFNASSIVRVSFSGMVTMSGILSCTCAIFRGSTCIGARSVTVSGSNHIEALELVVEDIPGTVGPHTYTVRVGPQSGTAYVNGISSGRLLGGQSKATLIIEEIL